MYVTRLGQAFQTVLKIEPIPIVYLSLNYSLKKALLHQNLCTSVGDRTARTPSDEVICIKRGDWRDTLVSPVEIYYGTHTICFEFV